MGEPLREAGPVEGPPYRADVDGLRAVAVLAVILFHLDARWVPGGFTGVDVFLAISGFLLTRNALGGIADGSFSVTDFYRRRARRIARPMVVVTGVVVAAAQMLFLPEDAVRTARAGLWSLASLANVWFSRNLDTGYFSREAHVTPLLHLWSLGLEEQFYLLWPLVLPLAARRSGSRIVLSAAIAMVAIASFAAGQALLATDRRLAFYLLPTRAGGLLLGAIAAVVATDRSAGARVDARRAHPRSLVATEPDGDGPGAGAAAIARSLVAVAGALLILTSFAMLDESSPFPGWRAALPSLGAALVLYAGACGPHPVSTVLSWRPLVAIGLVSYSAYLWHWPLVAFHRYAHGDPGPIAKLVIALLTAALSWASWRWIEIPARRSSEPLRAVLLRHWAGPSAAVVALATFAISTGGLGPRILDRGFAAELARLRERDRLAGHAGLACDRKRLVERDLAEPRCLVGPTGAPEGVVLWGDSHAAHYVGMMEVFARAGGFRFRTFDTWGCAPVGGDPAPYLPADRVEDCTASLRLALPRLRDFPVVVLAASWPGYEGHPAFVEPATALARDLAAEGRLVVLLGRAPKIPSWDRSCRAKALSTPWLACPTERFEPLHPWFAGANERLRDFASTTPGVVYFDANDLACADPRGCTAFADDGEPLYFDDSHLTLAGSRWLGEQVLRRHGLPEPFARVAARVGETGSGAASGETARETP